MVKMSKRLLQGSLLISDQGVRRCRSLIGSSWDHCRSSRRLEARAIVTATNCPHVVPVVFPHRSFIFKTNGHQRHNLSSKRSFPERRTRFDIQDLENETNALVQALEEKTTERSRITSQYCYQLLASWLAMTQESRQVDAARQAKHLIRKLEKHGHGTSLEPTRLFYDLVLQAVAVCDPREAQEFLLDEMPRNLANAKSFNICIDGWAKSRYSQAGENAEKLFGHLENLYNNHQDNAQKNSDLQPNQRTLTGVLGAWANSGHPMAYERILAICQHAIQKQQQSESDAVALDVVVFNTVLRSLANTQGDRNAAETCEQLLQLMATVDLEPNTQTYSMILHAWAQCESREQRGAAAQRAEHVLGLMIDLYSTQGSNVKPNTRSFTTCIAAWSRCDAPEKAQALLDRLLELYGVTLDPELRPDTPAGNAVVIAWSRARRPDAAHQTKQALDRLKEFTEPDLISYNSLLHAYSKEGNAKSAGELLEWLEEDSHLEPDAVSYNSVLNALAKSNDNESAIQAETMLEKMEDMAKQGRTKVQPTSISYTSVVNAWANSNDPSPFQAVYRVHERMRNNENNLRPDIRFFVGVIRALAKEQEQRQDALKMVLALFDEITSSNLEDEFVFVAMFDACNQLALDREEWLDLVSSMLRKCQESGFLSRRVLATLRRRANNQNVERVLGSHTTTDLPKSWSRKISRIHRP
jgi:hypothetical protein